MDVDLRMMGSPDDVLQRLQAAGRLNLGDFMRFEIVTHPRHPQITGVGVKYGGPRFLVVCKIADKSFGNPFGIDIGFGEPIFGEVETITAPDILDFIAVPPPKIRVYPVETHLAEKLHAYTLPQPDDRTNSRVKDLPDIALLAQTRPLRADTIRTALSQTFQHRATHALPRALADPPSEWRDPYARISKENGLPWPTLAAVTDAARRFLDPVLTGEDARTWSPQDWSWSTPLDGSPHASYHRGP